ncbi:MAG: CDP-alcohol phosphatidyltransferase family protein [Deltaproteobacteria bacterium]|nr:CDP-alcohol phosphatidyltransferase family protein [Deltaproteobacteria bacterium]
MAWVLRLTSAEGRPDWKAERKIAGLTTALRLAMSAQGGGAARVELGPGAESIAPLLVDPRLRIPVVAAGDAADSPPELVVEIPWNTVIHRDLLKALAASGAKGTRRLLAEPFDFHPPFGFEPILIVDRKAASRAVGALLNSLRKVQDGWTSTYLNRYVSLFFTRALVRTPLRPNQVSVGILLVGFVGAYLATTGSYWPMLVGAFLFQMQSILDGCDGELSRVTYRGSHLGEWLDTVGDDLTNYGFFAGTAVGMYKASGWWPYLVAGGVTVGCGVIASAIEYRYLYKIGSGDLLKYPLGVGTAPTTAAVEKGVIARALDAIAPIFKRDTFVLMTFIGAVAGLLGPFLLVFACGGVGILIAVFKAELRMARERRAQGT